MKIYYGSISYYVTVCKLLLDSYFATISYWKTISYCDTIIKCDYISYWKTIIKFTVSL